MDIMKRKKTIPAGTVIFTPASASANCSASCSRFNSPNGWRNQIRESADSRQLQIVEAGAHDGRLARDILTWLQSNRPELFDQIEYWIIEPSARRQEWQGETLREFAPRVRWFAGFQSLLQERTCHSSPATCHPPLRGVIFSNELLDAMPVHRFGWDAAKQKLVRMGRGG